MEKLFLILSSLLLVSGQNITTDIPISASTSTTTLLPVAVNYDFIVKFGIEMDESKLPNYVTDKIYEGNITMDDILLLYKLRDMNLSNFASLLSNLGFSPLNVLSIDGFGTIYDELNLDFTFVYNNILFDKLNLTGIKLKNFLRDLEIDTATFNDAIVYKEHDPWEIFRQGNFSQASLEYALLKVNKTPDDLFQACRDMFINNIGTLETSKVLSNLSKYSFSKEQTLQLWEIRNVSQSDLLNIESFGSLVSQLTARLRNVTSLGVIISSDHLATNEEARLVLEKEAWIGSITVDSLNQSSNIRLLSETNSTFNRLTIFKYNSNNKLPHIRQAVTDKDLQNCQFVTFWNELLYTENATAKLEGNFLKIEINITKEVVVPGSPLLCGNNVYGLAKTADVGKIIFDTFSNQSSISNVTANGTVSGTSNSTAITGTSTASAFTIAVSLHLLVLCIISNVFEINL